MKIRKKRSTIWKEFKDFINKGNIVDLATGIIVGSSFTKIVNSLVNDVIMPFISSLIKIDITSVRAILKEEVLDETGEVIEAGIYLNYGTFIQNIINFLIIAFAIFFAIRIATKIRNTYVNHQIKYIKKLKKKHPEFFENKDEAGSLLYEKLKQEHPEAFENEQVKKIEEKKKEEVKDPITINNELLTKLNENLELMASKLNKE